MGGLEKSSLAEKGYNAISTFLYVFCGILGLGMALVLGVIGIVSMPEAGKDIGIILLLIGLFVLFLSIFCFYLAFTKKNANGRVRNIEQSLGKFIK